MVEPAAISVQRFDEGDKSSTAELILMIRPFVLVAPGEATPGSNAMLDRLSEHPEAWENELRLPEEKVSEDQEKDE